MKKASAFLVLACALTGFGGSRALAGSTGYPGSMCVAIFGNSVFFDGIIGRNQTSSSKTFICNAVQTGGAITAWRVSVRDTTPVGEVVCNARASGEFDAGGFISPSASSGVADGGLKQLGVGLSGTAGYIVNGSKNIVCTMPPAGGFDGSGIASHSITES